MGEHIISIKPIVSAAVIVAVAIVAVPGHASALNNSNLNTNLDFWNIIDSPRPLVVTPEPVKPVVIKPDPGPVKPPEPRKYTVLEGDNLSKIAEQQSTTWPRLWNKNTDLKDPDVIHIGQVLLIPAESEVLEDRPLPARIVAQNTIQDVTGAAPRGSTSGNTYSPGYCTWYVKNRRPDLPNNLGNANTWYSRAAGQGLPVGSAPRAGAVGTTTAGDLGHVVYVESVNGDGSVTISEMNYRGLYSMNTRTVPASDFVYIY